jgi:hypothetical protein
LAHISPTADAVEALCRNVSTRIASPVTVAVVWALLLGAIASCGGDGNDNVNVVPTGSDGAGLTRLVFEKEDGSEKALFVEVADSSAERGRGLMLRESLPEGQGMLFVFEQDGQHAFYMRDTLIPLSIAFVKGDGTIVEIEDMEPQTEELHSGPEPYRYTVEANQGWFARNGIEAGSQVLIPALTP